MKKLLLPILFVLGMLLPQEGSAQSRAEKSQYGKIVKKPTVKAAEKFLDKYPASVYAPKVLRIRDSLVFFALNPEDAAGVLAFVNDYPDSPFRERAEERIVLHNTSKISAEEALAQAGDCLSAIGWRKDNVDHILALDKDLSLRILSPEGELLETRTLPVYTLSGLPVRNLAMPMELIRPLGNRSYIHFGYWNGDGSEYVEALYLPEQDLLSQVLFYGNVMEDGRIEGQSPETIEGLTLSAETAWLAARLKENPALVPLSNADYLSDTAFRWWQERNPKAGTASSVKLSFGKLDPESSLAEAYKNASKEKGKSYHVAKVTLRGYTAIVAAPRSGGEYLLVWCEPVTKGKQFRTYYFESDGIILDLVFYQGKSMYKLKISMANQNLHRL